MLTLPRLVLRNLRYHWRGNLAVLLGVAVGATVLTGALLVGDSLRGSLRQRAERQLGGIEAAALLPRPVRAAVADGMPGNPASVLLLPGSIQTTAASDAETRSIGRVTVLGVDDRFKPASVESSAVDWNSDPRSVVLSHRVADRLGARTGDKVKLGLQRFSDLPRSTLLAKRSLYEVTATFDLTVAAILPPDAAGNDFNLTPSPAAPLNVWVPLRTLSESLEEDARRRGPPKANALLASGVSVESLNSALRAHLQLEDWGLRVRVGEKRKAYATIEAEQLLMDRTTVEAIEKGAADLGLRSERTMAYLVNAITHGTDEIPYSIVAALNPSAAEPLGPFLPVGVAELKDNEIVLADWDQSPLKGLPPGTPLTVSYYNPAVEGEGKVETATLTLRGYVPLSGEFPRPPVTDDRDLTPSVRGITDEKTATIQSWNPPPPLDNKKIQAKIKPNDRNERYWNRYRATPKAYVNLGTGERLFGSRYGSVTSVRVAPAEDETPEQTVERLKPAILRHLDPAAAGMTFDPIRDRLLSASHGGTDFGGLFLGFSFFLIAAALMLVGLLFRLTLDRRAKEVGLLLAAGYSVRKVRRLVLAEGLMLAGVGAALGLVAAVGYNRLLLKVLLDLWPDPTVAGFLRPHATAMSFAIGFGLTLVMAFGALWLSVRGLVRVPLPALLRGETAIAGPPGADAPRSPRYSRLVALGSLPIGVVLLVAGSFVQNPDYQAMTFFGGGALLLTAALAGLWMWMKRTRHATVSGRGAVALARLGSRNAARNPTRSLLTAALLASAAFLLVAVESFRRQPGREFLDERGGSGGFNLIAETDIPLYQPFDAGPGRFDLEDRLQSAYGGTGDSPQLAAARAELDAITVFPLRLRGGDDASCLNLFQASRPRVLGVPDSLVRRGGFKFYETEAKTPDENANPWLLLQRPTPDGAVPVIVENNTAVWMLKTGVGGVITMPGDDGKEIRLRIVATLADSPFQSELLMADADFVRLFPRQDGFRVFLIRTPPGKENAVAHVLDTGLRANGLIATPTAERVAAYQAVIGAYLSTFQVLGGFGLLLGVLGLAVVVLRGVWERLGELALLRAVGYRTREIEFLVLAENALLLVVGLGAGVLAAVASVAPHVAEGSSVPWTRLAGMLALVLAVGLGVAFAATAGILRVPVIPALRRE
jgi:ABC-type lipoprotein release transport system permease subunit